MRLHTWAYRSSWRHNSLRTDNWFVNWNLDNKGLCRGKQCIYGWKDGDDTVYIGGWNPVLTLGEIDFEA